MARVLSTIEDPALRAHRAAAFFTALPIDAAVVALGEVVRGAAQGLPGHVQAAEAAVRALHELLGEPVRAGLRAAALEAGESDALALLTQRDAVRSFDSGEPGYVDREMQARSLGHRRELARGLDRDLLVRLVHDQDPTVLRNLLENPRVTEREVLIAASRRPTHAAVLEEIFRSRRWSSNRRVRKALALNPYTPPALAAASLSLLTGPELREVERDSHLRAEVRGHATRLLQLRMSSRE